MFRFYGCKSAHGRPPESSISALAVFGSILWCSGIGANVNTVHLRSTSRELGVQQLYVGSPPFLRIVPWLRHAGKRWEDIRGYKWTLFLTTILACWFFNLYSVLKYSLVSPAFSYYPQTISALPFSSGYPSRGWRVTESVHSFISPSNGYWILTCAREYTTKTENISILTTFTFRAGGNKPTIIA